jgi:hypothetical protein
MKSLYTFTLLSLTVIFSTTVKAQDYLTVEELSTQKQEAVDNSQYRLAKAIQAEIDKRPEAGTISVATASTKPENVLALENQTREAVAKEDWILAKSLKHQRNAALGIKMEPIISRWRDRENPKDYIVKEGIDGSLSYQIDGTTPWNHFKKTSENYYICDKADGPFAKNTLGSTITRISATTLQLHYKGNNKTYTLTKNATSTSIASSTNYGSNMRDKAYQKMKTIDYATANSYIPTPEAPSVVTNIDAGSTKIKNTEENEVAKDLKYRRSSLYTLMINDLTRLHSSVIKDAFGNSTLPQKFNDHNIGPYMIDGIANSDDQTQVITTYLNNNNVARDLIAKWFNRSNDGKFNMDLIASRGMYDATAMDKVIANSSERGDALLADAGEELIGNTFIIVNDYKFTNKEEMVAKAKKGTGLLKMAANYVPGGSTITTGINAAETAATIAGKGYIVKTTSYLYRLVWDEEAAAIFYNNYWTDNNNFDPTKVEAFNKATNFKLRLIGSQVAHADVQSSIFTDKSDEDLIRMASTKATDRAIAKLEKKYEEFRTKTPLFSTDPLAAKIGTKEGLEKGDKYEVIQQIEAEDGKTIYKRVGVIKVATVWDNSYTPEEEEELKKQNKLPNPQYSTFKGSGKYYPGMLIKQIN